LIAKTALELPTLKQQILLSLINTDNNVQPLLFDYFDNVKLIYLFVS